MSEFELPAGLPKWITDHVRLYQEDPEAAHMWDSTVAGGPGPLPTLLLISTGRQSGKPRPLPLLYKKIDDDYVIIASKGGAPSHPAWYVNLEANPECEIWVAKERMRARARTATGAERTAKWEALAEMYPPYRAYQKNADKRQIPVIVLEVTERLQPAP